MFAAAGVAPNPAEAATRVDLLFTFTALTVGAKRVSWPFLP